MTAQLPLLLEPADLAAHLDDDNLLIVDLSKDQVYDQAHVPGAVHLDFKRLLAGTDESIDEIVYLTGFSEPSTFYRAFKRWVGMTPIEYRKLKAEEDAAEAAAKL